MHATSASDVTSQHHWHDPVSDIIISMVVAIIIINLLVVSIIIIITMMRLITMVTTIIGTHTGRISPPPTCTRIQGHPFHHRPTKRTPEVHTTLASIRRGATGHPQRQPTQWITFNKQN